MILCELQERLGEHKLIIYEWELSRCFWSDLRQRNTRKPKSRDWAFLYQSNPGFGGSGRFDALINLPFSVAIWRNNNLGT